MERRGQSWRRANLVRSSDCQATLSSPTWKRQANEQDWHSHGKGTLKSSFSPVASLLHLDSSLHCIAMSTSKSISHFSRRRLSLPFLRTHRPCLCPRLLVLVYSAFVYVEPLLSTRLPLCPHLFSAPSTPPSMPPSSYLSYYVRQDCTPLC